MRGVDTYQGRGLIADPIHQYILYTRPDGGPGESTEQDLIDWCKQHLASFKKPSEVRFLRELPKSGYGKILKRETRKLLFPAPDASTSDTSSPASMVSSIPLSTCSLLFPVT